MPADEASEKVLALGLALPNGLGLALQVGCMSLWIAMLGASHVPGEPLLTDTTKAAHGTMAVHPSLDFLAGNAEDSVKAGLLKNR